MELLPAGQLAGHHDPADRVPGLGGPARSAAFDPDASGVERWSQGDNRRYPRPAHIHFVGTGSEEVGGDGRAIRMTDVRQPDAGTRASPWG